eukprot:84931_1
MLQSQTYITAIILVIFCVNNVFSRTCVCAEFIAEDCDSYLNCKWNLNTPKEGVNFGVCRSLKWYTCRLDPSCTIKSETEQQNEIEMNQYDNMDWPWDCQNHAYLSEEINVKEYQLTAEKNALKQSFTSGSIPSFSQSSNIASSIVMVALAMICGIIYYFAKCRKRNGAGYDVINDKTTEYYQIYRPQKI